jgi:hypothetical protein
MPLMLSSFPRTAARAGQGPVVKEALAVHREGSSVCGFRGPLQHVGCSEEADCKDSSHCGQALSRHRVTPESRGPRFLIRAFVALFAPVLDRAFDVRHPGPGLTRGEPVSLMDDDFQ